MHSTQVQATGKCMQYFACTWGEANRCIHPKLQDWQGSPVACGLDEVIKSFVGYHVYQTCLRVKRRTITPISVKRE